MPKLLIIIASVRPGRVGLPVAEWVQADAQEHGGFEIAVADLAEVALPFMDEPNHPSLHQYTRQHTLDWSARIDAADAFIFVTPEYNHGYSPALKNAIDYLHREWQRKPVGFVSYGGLAGGSRGVAGLEPVLTTVGLVKASANVEIPFAATHLDDDGAFQPQARQQEVLHKQLDELMAMDAALRPLR